MHIMHRHGWEIPEHQATPEDLFWNRRTFMAGVGAAAAIALSPAQADAQRAADADPIAARLGDAVRDEPYGALHPRTAAARCAGGGISTGGLRRI